MFCIKRRPLKISCSTQDLCYYSGSLIITENLRLLDVNCPNFDELRITFLDEKADDDDSEVNNYKIFVSKASRQTVYHFIANLYWYAGFSIYWEIQVYVCICVLMYQCVCVVCVFKMVSCEPVSTGCVFSIVRKT